MPARLSHLGKRWSCAGLTILPLTLWTPSWSAAQPPPSQPSTPTVTAQSPEPGKLIRERRPAITVAFEDPGSLLDPKSVAMEVDSVDVTLFLTVEAGKVT